MMEIQKASRFYRRSEGIFPWAVLAIMIGAFLATGYLRIEGPKTSFVIGLVGVVAILARVAHGWWLLLKGKLYTEQDRLAQLGLAPMMTNPLLSVLYVIGWGAVIILTVLSLG